PPERPVRVPVAEPRSRHRTAEVDLACPRARQPAFGPERVLPCRSARQPPLVPGYDAGSGSLTRGAKQRMLIGAMNHPAADVLREIDWMAEMGLGFVDLTLEPPAAASWRVDPKAIRAALDAHGMKVVGHTAFYLPMASAFEEVRCACVNELKRCMRAFAEVGAKVMNIHPDRHTPMHGRNFY